MFFCMALAPGAFANGATVGKQEEQFSSNLEVINSKVRATLEALR
jgi:hypothetical protein